jgi:hypothetical protein
VVETITSLTLADWGIIATIVAALAGVATWLLPRKNKDPNPWTERSEGPGSPATSNPAPAITPTTHRPNR